MKLEIIEASATGPQPKLQPWYMHTQGAAALAAALTDDAWQAAHFCRLHGVLELTLRGLG